MLVQVGRGLLADVRDVRCQLFHPTLGVTHLEYILVDVKRCEYVLANNAFVDHNRILEVVSLPWHEGHAHVLTQGQFAFVSGVPFNENLAFLHRLAFFDHGLQVHARALVGALELGDFQYVHRILERHEFVHFVAGILDVNFVGINKLHDAICFSTQQDARVFGNGTLQSGTNDWRGRAHQRHRLTHHVRSHQRTVGVIVLQERNQRGRNRSNLVRGNVHVVQLVWSYLREVTFQSRFNDVVFKFSFLRYRSVRLGNQV